MELTGLTEKQVDEYVAGFTTLMRDSTVVAFAHASATMETSSDVVVASPIDALGEIISSWQISVQTKLMPYLKNVFTKAGKTVAAPLAVDSQVAPSGILGDVESNLVSYANDLYDAGHLAVMVGWQDGETVMAMSDRLQAVPKTKEDKAHSIAQTAVTTAVNGGEWTKLMAIAAKYNAITTKEWVATHDSHTRPTHWAADGQVVALDAKFKVGGSLLDFPGDPFGDLEEIINCRCTTKYDAEIQTPTASPQSSPDALSADSAVDTTEQISASAATNSNWDAADHPRGKDGKFIKKGTGAYAAITKLSHNGKNLNNWTGSDQAAFVQDVSAISQVQWDNLTTEQKHDIEMGISDAMEQGITDSAIAQQHLDKLSENETFGADEPDLFDPDTPLPNTGTSSAADKGSVIMDVHDAYGAGKISKEEKDELLDLAKSNNFSADDLQEALDEAVTKNMSNFAAKEAVQAKIEDALTNGEITELEHATLTEFLQNDVTEPDIIEVQLNKIKKPPTTLAPWTTSDDEEDIDNASVPLTTGSPKPIKITHGLIHAKHAPGTTIAVGDNGDRITWNGTSYDITDADGNELHTGVKKSKLYALLNGSYYGGVNWNEPGAQPVAVTHATPLDAAPAPNPIPHPVNFPAPSAVDTALDDAFGPISIFQNIANGNTEAATAQILNSPGAAFAPSQSPSTPSVAQGLDMTGWVQVGGQAGSNKGALFEAPDGKRYYVKSLKSKEHAQNEVLAAALYRAAGINVPEVRHVTTGAPPGWSNVIASPIVPNAKSNKKGLTTPGKFKEQAQQTYAVTAWLANFDAVGLTHDNMIESDGQVHLIDVGGSMGYRAQGSKKKPGDWNEDPTSALNGLMDPSINPQAASVYGGMTYEQQRESAKALLGITDAQIDQMVKDAGLPPKQAAILKARRDAILKKYGLDKNNSSTSNTPVATVAPTNNPSVVNTPTPDPIAALLESHANNPIVITPMTTVDAPSPTSPDLDSTAKTLALGVLLNNTPNDIIVSLNKMHEAGLLTDKDFTDLVEGVQSGKVFMGKMVVGMHNTKVQAANYTVPDEPDATPISTSGTNLTPDLNQHDVVGNAISQAFIDGNLDVAEYDNLIQQLDNINPDEVDALDALMAKVNDANGVTPGIVMPGSPITANEIIDNAGQFAVGEVIATGVDSDGYQWQVSHAPGGYVYIAVDSPTGLNTGGVQTYSYPTFINTSNSENINWTASDGSTSLLPGPSKVAGKKAPAKKVTPGAGAAFAAKKAAAKKASAPSMPSVNDADAVMKLQSLLDDDNDPTSDEIVNAMEGMTQSQFDHLASWHKGNLNAYIEDAITDGTPGAAFAKAKLAALKSGYGDGFGENPDDLPPGVLPPSALAVSAPAVNTADIPGSKKYDFYTNFKAENVSPAWSGAKIYKSMKAAQLKMAGDHQISQLTDEQMLEILDAEHNDIKGLAPGTSAYGDKVKAWLQTPAGQKAFAQLNPGIATPPSGIAKKTTNPFTKAAAAKKAAAVGVDDTDINPGATSTSSTMTPEQKANIYAEFKASPHGKYLNSSKPEEIYWNAVQLGKQHGTTAGAILNVIDEEGAKKFGVPNENSFHNKVNAWIKTPSGQAKAKEIKAGTWSPGTAAAKKTTAKKVGAKKVGAKKIGGSSYYGSSGGGAHVHAASKPLNEKVPDVGGTIPPFDNNKSSSDFPVITPQQAQALQNEMEATHGVMTPKQKASLKHYTTNTGFSNMNNYLRGYTGASEATDDHVKNAQAGMRPSTRDIIVHRGNGHFGDWTSYENIKAKEGTNFHQESFFSTSVGGNAAFGGAISMEIEVPAGTPMAYVNAFSHYGDKTGGNKGEREILLAAGLEYKILSVKKNGYQTVVRMRVVPKGSS